MSYGRRTGAQFALVTLPSLEGGQIDDFTNKLFAKWGVGEKGKNNGVMLLVAVQDRKARIEPGYGLEPILPDALAGRVLDEQLFPAFKQGRYAQGMTQAVNRIAEIIERGEPASPEERKGKRGIGDQTSAVLFLSLFVAAGFAVVGAGAGTRQFFLVFWGLFFGGMPMLMVLATGGWGGWLLLVPAVLMFFVGWHLARSGGAKDLARKRGGTGWTWMGSGLGGFGGAVSAAAVSAAAVSAAVVSAAVAASAAAAPAGEAPAAAGKRKG